MVDEKLTKDIQQWLAVEQKTDEAICQGAALLLRINRNRVLYQNICRRPQHLLSKLTYELQKHLRYRLDGLTLQDVREMERKVLPEVKQAIDDGQPDTSAAPAAAAPVEQAASEQGEPLDTTTAKRGKRADHDSLPAEIQQLWTDNAERWKKMKEAFATCQTLDLPCDRYEYVKLLRETYQRYKADMATYDEWQPSEETPKAEPSPAAAVSSARSYISKHRTLFDSLTADGDAEKREQLREKIQQRVDVLAQNGAALSDDLTSWLTERGFTIAAATA